MVLMPTELTAFSAEQVSALTGLSKGRLRYWDQVDILSPEMVVDGRRVYSFRDLVGLRTLARLREGIGDRRFSLQELRKVDRTLRRESETPWASLALYVFRRKIYFRDKAGLIVATDPEDQTAFELVIQLKDVKNEMEARVRELRSRSRDQIGRIVQQRDVMRNAPVIAGTRITTSAIWEFHEDGYSIEDVMREYPRLTQEDVRAAIRFEERRRARKAG
jgi:uncharacterized protein (DUF433 family)